MAIPLRALIGVVAHAITGGCCYLIAKEIDWFSFKKLFSDRIDIDDLDYYLKNACHMASFSASLFVIQRLGPAAGRLTWSRIVLLGCAAGGLAFGCLCFVREFRLSIRMDWNRYELGVVFATSWAVVWSIFWSWEAARRKRAV